MKYLMLQFFGISVMCIAIAAFIGHLSKQEWLYTWNTNQGIPLPSSITGMLIGISIFLIGEDLKQKHEQRN